MQLLSDANVPNNKLIDFEPPDPGAADRQGANSERADGQRPNGDGSKRQRPNRLCPDAGRWAMSEPRRVIGSIVVRDISIAFTRRHQWLSSVSLTWARCNVA